MIAPLRAVKGGLWSTGAGGVVTEPVAVVEVGARIPAPTFVVHRETLECGHAIRHDPPKVETPGRERRRRCPTCAADSRRVTTDEWKEIRNG